MIDLVWRRFSKVRNTFRFGGILLLSCLVIVIAIKQVQASATQTQTLEQLIGKPIAQQIETHVRALASYPHEAGTDANTKTAEYYAKRLREYGFDEVIFKGS